MPKYKKKNWRVEWGNAKEHANLGNWRFRKGLGKLLDAQEIVYDNMMKADATTFPKLFGEHGKNAVKIRDVLIAYRKIVKDNGDDPTAIKVLGEIDTQFLSPQLDDRMDRQQALKPHK